MIPRFLLLSESCSGLFVTDLDTMLGLPEGDVSEAVARRVLEATGWRMRQLSTGCRRPGCAHSAGGRQ